jgi:DNA modification methylase
MENEKDIWGEIRELLGSCTTPAAEERATRTAGPVEAVIVQGDCVQAMTSLRPESVDLIVTDPPYLCRFKNRRGQTIQNDDRGDWVLPAYVNMYRALKPDSVCVTFCGWRSFSTPGKRPDFGYWSMWFS